MPAPANSPNSQLVATTLLQLLRRGASALGHLPCVRRFQLSSETRRRWSDTCGLAELEALEYPFWSFAGFWPEWDSSRDDFSYNSEQRARCHAVRLYDRCREPPKRVTPNRTCVMFGSAHLRVEKRHEGGEERRIVPAVRPPEPTPRATAATHPAAPTPITSTDRLQYETRW